MINIGNYDRSQHCGPFLSNNSDTKNLGYFNMPSSAAFYEFIWKKFGSFG